MYELQNMVWLAAKGLGEQCNHPVNKKPDDENFRIPHPFFTCSSYQYKEEVIE